MANRAAGRGRKSSTPRRRAARWRAPLDATEGDIQKAVDIGALQLDSPALDGLRQAGIKLVVPLVSQGELIGLLNLGPRRSEQEYSADDRKLLNDLAGHAAPAVRVAQLVREQEAEVRQRERIEQELRVAQLIQQQFLPQELPDLPGWQVGAYYGPAREVGGDFYDFIRLPDDQIGIVVGDVTDKGVPAALVMATTHSILRAEAPRLIAPSAVLTRANELLVDEMPAHMFVTCLYAVLNPATGRLRYANAGHNVPYVSTEAGVTELRATGMPLGLLPGMEYEEKEATLAPGEIVLLHSDGLAEAHNTDREMFGFPRVAALTGEASDGEVLIDRLLKVDTRNIGWHGNAILVKRNVGILDCAALDLPTLEPRGAVMAELFGRVDGVSSGRGGSISGMTARPLCLAASFATRYMSSTSIPSPTALGMA